MTQDWGPSGQLVVNGKVRGPLLAKQGRVFGLIVNVCVVGSFQRAMHNISKGDAIYPLPFAKVNHHIGKCLGCQLRV
jgi:hypothetical protein